MAKHAGAHKAEKRRKELLRQKKQEEKRKRRLQKNSSGHSESAEGQNPELEVSPQENSEQQP